MERMENNRIAKRICAGECAGSPSVGRPQKRWIDNMKECFRKRGLDLRQLRKWCRIEGVCEGECMGCSLGYEPLTLMRCYSCGLPQLYESLEE